jgi:hypothetical protein
METDEQDSGQVGQAESLAGPVGQAGGSNGRAQKEPGAGRADSERHAEVKVQLLDSEPELSDTEQDKVNILSLKEK